MIKEAVFQEVLNMGITSIQEAIDMIIALYPYLSRSDQADIITMFRNYYDSQ